METRHRHSCWEGKHLDLGKRGAACTDQTRNKTVSECGSRRRLGDNAQDSKTEEKRRIMEHLRSDSLLNSWRTGLEKMWANSDTLVFAKRLGTKQDSVVYHRQISKLLSDPANASEWFSRRFPLLNINRKAVAAGAARSAPEGRINLFYVSTNDSQSVNTGGTEGVCLGHPRPGS